MWIIFIIFIILQIETEKLKTMKLKNYLFMKKILLYQICIVGKGSCISTSFSDNFRNIHQISISSGSLKMSFKIQNQKAYHSLNYVALKYVVLSCTSNRSFNHVRFWNIRHWLFWLSWVIYLVIPSYTDLPNVKFNY